MSYGTAALTAAAFRSTGLDTAVVPNSDDQTLELAGFHSGGEECLPHKITLGDFLKVCRQPGFDAEKAAFFMPHASGPCRFGQYAPYLRQVLDEIGCGDALVVSPTSADGYDGVGEHAGTLMHTVWMGIVLADLTQRFMLKTRPYETIAGDADAAFHYALDVFGEVLALEEITPKQRLPRLVDAVSAVRDRFRAIPARYEKGRPFVGVVGEIFCRLNTFSNEDLARRVERLGGECWLSDTPEWVWYTNWCRGTEAVREEGRLSLRYLKHRIKTHYQHRYEQRLLAPVAEDFRTYEEPHDIRELIEPAWPYLPGDGALGEMVLSVGKAIYLYNKGGDGVIDIAPFTCMNGIVSEAVYPAVSADHDDLPIRMFYFDKATTNVDRDLEIFLDLARAYQKRKRHPRAYPDYFE